MGIFYQRKKMFHYHNILYEAFEMKKPLSPL